MPAFLCIRVQFLQPYCHGRGDQGEPEWPPSPLRLFQALACAAAARWNERTQLTSAAPALRWLERQGDPIVIAAHGQPSNVKYRLYVPDNVADKVAASWARGRAASIADYRTEKDVQPTNLPHGSDAVHYLWPLANPDPDFETHEDVLFTASRSITHLGWGVDMVAAHASVLTSSEVEQLPGERWRPTEDRSTPGLRVPVAGTLDDLIAKHHAFLNRLSPDGGFVPVPPLSAFRVVGYRRATDPPRRHFAAFSLRKPDASGFRPFDTVRQGKVVAAMLRHAASQIAPALGWDHEKVARFVLGHAETNGAPHQPVDGPRLAFLPLPSIEPRGPGRAQVVASIRRVLLVVHGDQDRSDLDQLARLLTGEYLQREGESQPVAMLSRLADNDSMVKRYYTESGTTWATVTPVVLPGHDDPRQLRQRLFTKDEGDHLDATAQRELLAKLDRRMDNLLRKAIFQAGYSQELARDALIEWRPAGFWPGTDLAWRYEYPAKLQRFRRVHVQITWHDAAGHPLPIAGPICLGGGRFHGLGLFARCEPQRSP